MKRVAILAAMLMALVVAWAPITHVDHWPHAGDQAHAAAPLATALLDEHDDHGAVEAEDDVRPDDPSTPQFPHHHHDAPSALASPSTPALTEPWVSFVELTPAPARRLDSAGGQRQDRPPRIALEHLA